MALQSWLRSPLKRREKAWLMLPWGWRGGVGGRNWAGLESQRTAGLLLSGQGWWWLLWWSEPWAFSLSVAGGSNQPRVVVAGFIWKASSILLSLSAWCPRQMGILKVIAGCDLQWVSSRSRNNNADLLAPSVQSFNDQMAKQPTASMELNWKVSSSYLGREELGEWKGKILLRKWRTWKVMSASCSSIFEMWWDSCQRNAILCLIQCAPVPGSHCWLSQIAFCKSKYLRVCKGKHVLVFSYRR